MLLLPAWVRIALGEGKYVITSYARDSAVSKPDSLAIAAIAEAILMRTSAKKVPSLRKGAPRYLKLVT